ncbi:sensor histidine kinase [Larsenimonas rhizosphaerae]|uniref:histidine kinase n=1 Tax=Larsenimonas rhizosphaerae TaxID=2944682 RepID=A0AA42CWK2_9GAMM|nr:ATP-binding protein [Larsenimonas rhizosphaerae]MCM2130029.1 ATP-binding protein [Larsenimonas rhizosphaerae]MCX2522728.1 ATP-binding protein [Larsenimonas rhizosphaerae]
MANKASRHWRPRSLPQLVLLAFLMVMLPMGVLIFQAGQTLSELSELADVSARQAVDQTRRARTLTTLSVEMERSARQYAVLEDPGLMNIYRERAARYKELLDQQASLLDNDPVIDVLNQQLDALRNIPDASLADIKNRLDDFQPFARDTDKLLDQTRDVVDARIDSIRARAREVKNTLWLQASILVPVSLALILFFTWLIIRPIKQLEKRILGIGSGDRQKEPPRLQGPSELINLGERLNWLSNRLEELEAQKQQFLRHMSHELKTPLASIREGAGLLADGIVGELSPRQKEIVLLLDDSSQELQTLIEQLLDYNLLQHNRKLQVKRFDVAAMVQDVLNKHHLGLDNKQMVVSWSKYRLAWQADRTRTMRIVDNLVSNAVAYGEDGGKLWVRAFVHDEMLYIEVANTGEPIAEKDRDHLFEPFYQGSSKRKGPLKGSGIGLSVAAESAAAQDGSLALVEDDDGEATVCFRLILPWLDDNGSGHTDQAELERA